MCKFSVSVRKIFRDFKYNENWFHSIHTLHTVTIFFFTKSCDRCGLLPVVEKTHWLYNNSRYSQQKPKV